MTVKITKKILCLFLAAAMCLLSSCRKSEQDERTKAYAEVNGEEITVAEYEYFYAKFRAQIINDFADKYSAEYSEAFWNTEFDGITPAQALAEKALSEAVSAKIKLILMREKGIYPDISYEGLYAAAVKFNEDNRNKGNIAGIKSINLEQFYSYYISTGEMKLKNLLSENELKPDEAEISELAEQLKISESANNGADARSMARSKLIEEKYNEYISGLIKSAQTVLY